MEVSSTYIFCCMGFQAYVSAKSELAPKIRRNLIWFWLVVSTNPSEKYDIVKMDHVPKTPGWKYQNSLKPPASTDPGMSFLKEIAPAILFCWEIFPNFRDENKESLSCHHLVIWLEPPPPKMPTDSTTRWRAYDSPSLTWNFRISGSRWNPAL